ncbi:autoinducer binding domain-containing protein (plasmid) [Bradyrhizobium barranii subsp. apii]|uniref:Autoinducer binding domain-containing protein n=3 Tax=Bradyrhizobium TaxID=374 RepID=A0A8T5VH91_9BRAD|nr:autoinducer binding domain-containing protein [Bradyrhizobium barranii]UPT92387.1 autoinducer binding domain-containing protein [Bradyrhizobium barranii subsp. apii]
MEDRQLLPFTAGTTTRHQSHHHCVLRRIEPGARRQKEVFREIMDTRRMDLKTWFQRLTDVTSAARTQEVLRDALPDLVEELGFDCYAYLYIQPSRTYAYSNYSPEWLKHYFDSDYTTIDPVVKTASTTLRPFTWCSGGSRHSETKEVRRFYSEAGDFGIRSGISIPIRTACRHMSMLTLASSKPSLTLDKDIDQIAAVTAVAFLHAKLEEHNAKPTAQPTFELTAKQTLCLKWSAEGKPMKSIATLENMSFATVNFHLNNARKVLDAGSLAQATALATKLGLI